MVTAGADSGLVAMRVAASGAALGLSLWRAEGRWSVLEWSAEASGAGGCGASGGCGDSVELEALHLGTSLAQNWLIISRRPWHASCMQAARTDG